MRVQRLSAICLNLTGNKIQNAGVQYICDALRINKTLKNLSLGNYRIHSEGVEFIVEAIEVNRTLISLNLSAPYYEFYDFSNNIGGTVTRNT